LAALRSEPGARSLLGLLALQYVGLGALDVLVVVLAIGLLSLGPSGAGYLNSAFGAGGVVGALVTLGLIGRDRLAVPLVLGGLAWGLAFILLGLWPTVVGAFGLFAAAGASRTLLDVSGRTLLQRTVPSPVRGRIFGILEGGAMLGFAVGSASVPVLTHLGGPRTAIAGVGVLLVAVIGTVTPRLAGLEAGVPSVHTELALLRGSAIFGVLAAPELEELARALAREAVPAGEVVVREGERGDRFYLVGAGKLSVSVDGVRRRELEPGDGFGEIALLRDGIRTATVTALEPATLFVLDRAAFLGALGGSAHARRAAEAGVIGRLLEDRESGQAPALTGN
jgi:MFS family permease